MTAQKMVWYSVSVLITLERKRRPRYLVFENVYLIRARSGDAARRRGIKIGRAEADAHTGIKWDGNLVKAGFGGIRKVIECFPWIGLKGGSSVVDLHDGVEATYSRYLVDNSTDLRKLAAGKVVPVIYEE